MACERKALGSRGRYIIRSISVYVLVDCFSYVRHSERVRHFCDAASYVPPAPVATLLIRCYNLLMQKRITTSMLFLQKECLLMVVFLLTC